MKIAGYAEQERHRPQLATLQSELKSVVASSKAANNQAKLRIEDAKTQFSARESAIRREVARAQRNLCTVRNERVLFATQILDLTAQRDQLKLDLAD